MIFLGIWARWRGVFSVSRLNRSGCYIRHRPTHRRDLWALIFGKEDGALFRLPAEPYPTRQTLPVMGSPWLAGLGVISSADTSSAARFTAWVRRSCLSSALSPGTSGPTYSR